MPASSLPTARGAANGAWSRMVSDDSARDDATAEERTQFKAELVAYKLKVRQWQEETPRALRNSALGGVTALLLGLMGSVIGGWLASGEPMNFTHYRTRMTAPVPPT